MFFDVWTAYKQVCGGATLTKEDRLHILHELEERIRESERGRIRQANLHLDQLTPPVANK